MLKIGEKYLRTSPSGEFSNVHIKNQGEREYHRGLETEGFKYVEIQLSTGGTCTSCEG